jgi:hypothetical protein
MLKPETGRFLFFVPFFKAEHAYGVVAGIERVCAECAKSDRESPGSAGMRTPVEGNR